MTLAPKRPVVPRRRAWWQRSAPRTRAWLCSPRGEDGFADFVICLPVFFLLVVAGIQFALWSHAAHLARAAAEQGSQVATGYGSSPSAGTQAAYGFIATTGPGTLAGAHVSTTTLPGGTAQVTVTGRAQAIIPWLDLSVSATSDAPIQEYRPSG